MHLTKQYIKDNLFRSDGKFNGKRAKALGICPKAARRVWLDAPVGEGVCALPNCFNLTTFLNFSEGYSEFCSRKCTANGTHDRKQAASLKKYGTKNPRQNKDIQAKVRATCRERYGGNAPSSCKTIQAKIAATNIERRGVKAPSQCKKVQATARANSLERWGVPNPMQNEEVKDRLRKTFSEKDWTDAIEMRKQTCLAFYGHVTNMNTPEFRQYCIDVSRRNYGVDYPAQSEEMREKSRQSNLSKYGVENYSYSHLEPKSIEVLTDKELFQSELQSSTVFEVSEKLGVHLMTVYQKIRDWDLTLPTVPSGWSSAETQLREFLEENNIEYEANTRKLITPKEIDIYIPGHNLAIEYDGVYWHSEQMLSNSGYTNAKTYHLEKTEACEALGIQLFHIFENEWIDPVRKDIWKSKILIRCGKAKRRIPARKCNLVDLTSIQFNSFCIANHLQGAKECGIRKGLMHEEELVAVAGFKKEPNEEGVLNLERLAFTLNTVVVGGSSKLLKPITQKIVSFADRRISQAHVYHKVGFEEVAINPPSYKYLIGDDLQPRERWMKRRMSKKLENYAPELTEYQNMRLHGFDRVWDSGNIKLVRKPQ